MIRLVITRNADGVHCALEGNSAVWECGKTTAEAVGRWVIAHGADRNLYLVVPGTEGVDPDLPDATKGELSEDDLFAFANDRTGRPMNVHEREWCLQEIASVEGYNRADYEQSDNKQLARGVLTAWVDYCRTRAHSHDQIDRPGGNRRGAAKMGGQGTHGVRQTESTRGIGYEVPAE